MELSFSIDPDIRVARTPPGWLYTDTSCFQRLRAGFAIGWQWLDAAPPEAGHVQPVDLLPGSIDEPLLLTHDEQGVHCLSNVCTHRANLVCTQAMPASGLACGYHGRTFDLAGHCLGMPEFEAVEDFPSPGDDLPQLPLERLGPLCFTALQHATPFAEWIAPVRERLVSCDFDALQVLPERDRDYDIDCHWLLYCENYAEGFHIPFVHRSLNDVLAFDEYHTELFPSGSVQVGVAKTGEVAFEGDQNVGGYYFWLFPNLMLNIYPWGLSLNAVTPLAIDRTRVSFRTFVWNRDLLDQGAGKNLHAVELEDEAVVEQVQRGVRSRLHRRSHYSPTQERGVHHLHRMIARLFEK